MVNYIVDKNPEVRQVDFVFDLFYILAIFSGIVNCPMFLSIFPKVVILY